MTFRTCILALSLLSLPLAAGCAASATEDASDSSSAFSAPAKTDTIFGTITADATAAPAQEQVEIVCAGRVIHTAQIASGGVYRLTATSGLEDCEVGFRGATAAVVLNDAQPKRYDFTYSDASGTATLTQR